MQYNKVIFANSLWLWGLLFIPIIFVFFKWYKNKSIGNKQLTNFADPELLPHLLKNTTNNKPALTLLHLWYGLWLLGIIAMANPRWKFIEYETYKPESALAIVLDLAQSMQAEDLKPTRIVRAKQQIQDILKVGQGIRIGVIGFAKLPHLITPITDDFTTILHLLPAVDIDLIRKQGHDLNAALLKANKLLQAEPGQSKHILIISDGNFHNNFFETIKELKNKHIIIHVIAVGTEEGSPFKDASGIWKKQHGKMVISKLQESKLKAIAKSGGGKYWHASYDEANTLEFIKQVLGDGANIKTKEATTVRQWEEGFFWLIFPMLILALLLYRKNLQLSLLVVAISLSCVTQSSFALEDVDNNHVVANDKFLLFGLLHNNEQQGEIFFRNGDYEKAAQKFSDPYRKGVALYKAGQFAAAEEAFKNSIRPEVKLQAKYNLGNAQLKQGKYQKAVATYETVLAEHPDYKPAQANLAIAKELLKNAPKPPKQKDKKPPCNCANKQKSSIEKNDANSSNNTNEEKSADGQNGNKNEQDLDKEEKSVDQQKADTSKQDSDKNSQEKKQDQENDAAMQDKKLQDKEPTSSLQELDKASSGDEQKNDPETEVWLKRMNNDIKVFLRNKFFIEEQTN